MTDGISKTRSRHIDAQREYFDKIAPSWREKGTLSCDEIDSLLKNMPLECGNRVLDVACGAGVLAESLLARGLEVDAIDVSPLMIEKARNNAAAKGVNFAVEDFYEYESDRLYDCLLVFDAYPHFTDKAGFAKKAFELLREGGTLWIFFDESREKINGYHSDHNSDISVDLLEITDECAAFCGMFDVIYSKDDDINYCLGLKKREQMS